RLAGRPDDARATLRAALKADPKGPWSSRLRAELAAVEVAAGRFDRAEALARGEAEALLDDGRKDRLAGVYRVFAGRLLEPDSPSARPDPEGAHALFEQGRNLAKGVGFRAELLMAMARASQAVPNPGRAIGEFRSYLNESPKGADRPAARFHLGEAQSAVGQPQQARLTWSDLARDLEKVDTKDAQALRARALFGIARTYGMPAPGDDTALNLGVAALRRLVASYPGDALAVRGAFEIGAAYLARGKSQEGLGEMSRFAAADDKGLNDEARKVRAGLVMAAQFQVGQILQGQEKFDEAIAARQSYLARFPNGPQSADAQRAVLATRLLIAQDLLRRGHPSEARRA
ncbi:MAG: tetratricopeptide repeat protein, partial [Planctomycetia bacterium]|nr:tetratricopeptide repeat protein [Planctomycetia bacterium]